ncbi:MAG TPA: hypothetical protein VNI52_01385 [Sphingobacteriaceae bacterium]|nr:hypothetical protein [Sphingobacteriaceae bacterium]
MKNLSLKLEDNLFKETEAILNKINKNRNGYINEALKFYNKLQNRKLLASQLSKESKLVKNSSMEVLSEFEMLDNED